MILSCGAGDLVTCEFSYTAGDLFLNLQTVTSSFCGAGFIPQRWLQPPIKSGLSRG
jgi:hypothetical protein